MGERRDDWFEQAVRVARVRTALFRLLTEGNPAYPAVAGREREAAPQEVPPC